MLQRLLRLCCATPFTMSSERLQHNLSLLKPFNKLNEDIQEYIREKKRSFPDPSNELLRHLMVLGVPQLCDYLAWMPFERFTGVEILGRGGFATVWKGAVEFTRVDGSST